MVSACVLSSLQSGGGRNPCTRLLSPPRTARYGTGTCCSHNPATRKIRCLALRTEGVSWLIRGLFQICEWLCASALAPVKRALSHKHGPSLLTLYTKPLLLLHLHSLTPLQYRLVHSLSNNLLVTHFRSLRLASTLFQIRPVVSYLSSLQTRNHQVSTRPALVSRRCDCNDCPINSEQRFSIRRPQLSTIQ